MDSLVLDVLDVSFFFFLFCFLGHDIIAFLSSLFIKIVKEAIYVCFVRLETAL